MYDLVLVPGSHVGCYGLNVFPPHPWANLYVPVLSPSVMVFEMGGNLGLDEVMGVSPHDGKSALETRDTRELAVSLCLSAM